MAKSPKAAKGIFINDTIWYGVSIVDSFNTSGIYSGYVTIALLNIFRETLQFIFFPIYAINALIYAVLSIPNLLLDRHEKTHQLKTEHIIRLAISLLSATIVGIAVIGSLFFAAAMGIATTFLFAANFALTGIYNFIGAGYHFAHFVMKGKLLKNPDLSQEDRERLVVERQKHFGSMIGYFVTGVTVAMCALAASLAILGGFLPLAGIGIAAGVLSAGFSIFALVKTIQRRKAALKEQAEEAKSKKDLGEDNSLEVKEEVRQQPNSTLMILRGLGSNISSTFANLTRRLRTHHVPAPAPEEHAPLVIPNDNENLSPRNSRRCC
jgi:hypothetical protein